jgi:hypothetical protein
MRMGDSKGISISSHHHQPHADGGELLRDRQSDAAAECDLFSKHKIRAQHTSIERAPSFES